MTRSLNFGNHLQVPHLLFFSQIPPLHLQRLLQLRISILFSTLPHHFCCLPPSPPSGQSLKQDWQSLQCFLLPYNSSVLVPILVALGPHWVPISLSGSLSIKISIHSLCSSICFLLSKNGICSRPRLMTILFHFLPSFFTLTIGKTVLETWHLRHWLQFWQLRTWIQTIILTWQLIVTLDSIRNRTQLHSSEASGAQKKKALTIDISFMSKRWIGYRKSLLTLLFWPSCLMSFGGVIQWISVSGPRWSTTPTEWTK